MQEMQLKEALAKKESEKQVIIGEYLKSIKGSISYTGAYYLVIQDGKAITAMATTDEIVTYIKGWNHAMVLSTARVEQLEDSNTRLNDMNKINIERYEKIIADMGGETIEHTDTAVDDLV